ncbi:MAG TPA: MBL fold metallo-hydrolase [Thermoleophilaceae bacterium]|nr:MBL fold metallo-hydrolase [Thermoleophilaceae bacterium]
MTPDAFAPAAAAGIHRIPVPTPFAVGRVNVYLIEDEPLTLVDTGPNSGTSLDELERGLAERGRAIEDLELIVLTHQHIDHLGLVGVLRRRSGAEVAASECARPFVERYGEEAAADDEFAVELMRRHGVPDDMARALRAVSAAFRGWGAHTTVDRVLRDGDPLALRDRTLEVASRPGHSPSDTSFHDRGRRLLLGGDHLLKDISSNPLATRPRDGGEREQALVTYLDSLRATYAMEIDFVLPGHGDPIDDHRAVIDARLALHERRAAKLERLIGERPRTAYELARELWGDIAVTQTYLTLSEVLGHTDLLVNAGRVREEEWGDVVRFARVE